MNNLIGRLKAATGPDSQLDKDIARAAGAMRYNGAVMLYDPLTASIDAALTLVGRVGRCEFGQYDEGDAWWAYLHFQRDGHECMGEVEGYANAPLAMLGAYFTALKANGETK